MYKKLILAAAMATTFGAQAQVYSTVEQQHGFRFVGHVDEVCGFSEIGEFGNSEGKIAFMDANESTDVRRRDGGLFIKDDGWISFKVKSNTGNNPTITISNVETEGGIGKITDDNTTFFVRDDNRPQSSRIKPLDSIRGSMTIEPIGSSPLWLGVTTSAPKPALVGDFAIIPTVTVTCN
ncbi:hypothetical protein [Vibrio parahaemolyticus]|uniref:hypothetical protein n=1 Tax=Vibrio parahaemolyticus TaxID=670 RepID=UPI00226B3015|nr:hypothetical protein [Vibrio parahaemolyticus]MCX8941259.1 hypothetical protein [Vibrio parahaemolyticus]